MSDPNLYTIGWICAITTELVAARALLDERHDPPESVAQHDNNSYALGRMGRHNVVIAALPKSEYGTTAAATVAREMLSSFPNVRLGLVVGIGGGAPSKTQDIRLGDIVVGTRDLEARKGGIIQYDYGKTIQDRAFAMTGSLNQAPQALLTAVSNLEAQYALDGHRLNQHIDKALERFPRLRKTHRRPSMGSDRLYHPHIVHPSMESQTRCIDSCGEEPFHLVTRRQRDEDEDNPAIHYGLIASANQLMKDACVRDRLAEETGVLCFEMEAAGLMNHFPCLVIRGICDYSDTHKNKEWQGFAAISAAAYAKDLLGGIAPSKLASERKLADMMTCLLEESNAQSEHIDEIRSAVLDLKSSEHVETIRRWLSPPEASSIANYARSVRQAGTGSWIFQEPTVRDWILENRQHIWLHGLPGCGKTVLSTSLLDHLEETPDSITLQFFFDFRDVRKQTLAAMLCSIIFQVYLLGGNAAVALDDLYKNRNHGFDLPCTDALIECLKNMIKDSGKAFVLLDALDECTTRTELIEWIKGFLRDARLTNVKFMLLSRPEDDLQQSLRSFIGEESCVPLSKSLINSDISSHVRARLEINSGFKRWAGSPWVLEKISHEIGAKANGMFRWAACQLDALEYCLDIEMVETALSTLPQTLYETYDRILNSIPPERKQKAIRLLQFLVHSERPLTLGEAVEMLAVRPEGFAPKNIMPYPREITQLCPGFLILQPTSTQSYSVSGQEHGNVTGELHLAHLSVKEYLLNYQADFQRFEANASITSTCLDYLTSVAESTPQNTDTFFPFVYYAGNYSFSHARIAMNLDKTARKTADFLQNKSIYRLLGQLCHQRSFSELGHGNWTLFSAITHQGGILDLACFLELDKVVEVLLNRGMSVEGTTREGALYAAVDRRSVPLVELLLGRGAKFNAPHILSHIARRGGRSMKSTKKDLTIMSLLLDKGADANSSHRGVSVLSDAVRGGSTMMMTLLIQRGANVNAIEKDETASTALIVAVRKRFYEGVKMLLTYGADPGLRKPGQKSPHEIALGLDTKEIATILLDKEADLCSNRGNSKIGLYKDHSSGHWKTAASQWPDCGGTVGARYPGERQGSSTLGSKLRHALSIDDV